MKKCIDCKTDKELNDFPKDGKWYRKRCKKCYKAIYNMPTGKPNIGRFKKGNKPSSPFKKGNIPWNKDKAWPADIQERLRNAQKGRKHSFEEIEKRRQSLLKFWSTRRKNGRTCIKGIEWSRAVRNRDGNKCQKCGSLEKLHAHHIIPWRKNEVLRFELTNGITYCNSCHHKIEGFQKGHNYWKGRKMSFEHRKKMSDSHKGKIPWNKKGVV